MLQHLPVLHFVLLPKAALFSAALLFSTQLLSSEGLAQSKPSVADLVPYTANYSAKIGNIPISGSATVALNQNNDGVWQLAAQAHFLIYKLLGHSRFSYKNGYIQPLDYLVETSILGHSRTTTIDFNWDKKQAASKKRNKHWQVPLQRNDLDMITFQQQIQIDSARGKKKLSYQIIDSGDRDNYSFRYLGDELLHTAAGMLRTARWIRVREDKKKKRTTYVWLARDWHALPVQIQHLEKGKNYLLALKSAVVNHKKVHGLLTPSFNSATKTSTNAIHSIP